MDTALIRRELGNSVRLLGKEQRLLGGSIIALVAFVLWVGATGAAINYGADFAGLELSVIDWSSTTTAVFALAGLLWVLAPAAVLTFLVDDAITNQHGHIDNQYRFHHPFLLVAPFLLLFVVVAGVALGAGTLPAELYVLLSVLGLYALARTLAASYRVFSLSRPWLVETFLFLSLSVTAIALLAGAATVAGRERLVEAAADGIADVAGSPSVETVFVGSTTVNGVTIPYILGAAAGVPVGLVLLYAVVQMTVGVVRRNQNPKVRRSELRTGQRYPDFARPVSEGSGGKSVSSSSTGSSSAGTTGSSTSSSSTSGSSTSTGSTASSSTGSASSTGGFSSDSTAGSGSSGATASEEPVDSEAEDEEDEVEKADHTKVFTPPADTDEMGGDDAGASPAGSMTENTTEESSYQCPSCGDRYSADVSFDYCTNCGGELEEE